MTDFASLAIEIDASQTKTAAAELDNLTAAGARTERAAAGLVRAHQSVTVSAGAQRAAMQQLSYQIGDVSQGFALGVNPMVIFAQQGGQVIQALTLMQGEAKGLLGFLGGPWGAVVMGAATVVGMLYSKLGDAATGMNDLKIASDVTGTVQSALSGIFNMTTGAAANQTPVIIALAKAHIILAQAQAQSRLADANAAISDSTQKQKSGIGAGAAGFYFRNASQMYGPERNISRQFQEGLINANQAIDKLRGLRDAGSLTAEAFTTLSVAFANSSAETQNLNTLNTAMDSILSNKVAPSLLKTATAHSANAAAVKDDTAALTQFAEAMALAAANLTGFLTVQSGKQTTADLKWEYTHMFDGMNDEYKKHLEQLREAAEWQDIINEGIKKQQDEYISLGQSIARIGGIGGTLGGIIGALGGNAGGLSPALQTILGTKIGGTDKVTGQNDPNRTLLKGITEIFTGKDGKFGKTMTEVLQGAGTGLAVGSAIFGQDNGSAQTGSTIGGALGSAAFKKLAPKLFEKLGDFAGPLGSLVFGAIGGLLGAIFGGAKKGSASITNSGISAGIGGNADLRGQSSSMGSAAQTAIAKVADILGGTVGNYGFTIGMRNDEFRVSGNANADVVGKSPSAAQNIIYRGKDAQEAAKAAILNAIQDGAITGIREGAQRLLKAGGDLDTAVNKALKFNSVFDDLKQATDPMAYALDTLTKKFDGLRKLFDEAGASASDYADLEKLLGIERQKSIDSARQAVVDNLRDPLTMQIKILEMLGQSEEALAGSRLMELAGMKATLQPLQDMIYQLSDAQDIINKFSPLAAGLRAFRTELLGNGSDQSYGFLAAQFRATASASAMGDATAMGNLRGTATSFLDAAKANATSGLEYRRAVGEVLAGVDKGIFAADTQVEYAQMQIDAIKNTNTILADMKAELATLQSQVVVNSAATLKLWTRITPDGDSIMVSTNNSDPLQVTVVAS